MKSILILILILSIMYIIKKIDKKVLHNQLLDYFLVADDSKFGTDQTNISSQFKDTNINYDNLCCINLERYTVLFFDIFARNNELILIIPVYGYSTDFLNMISVQCNNQILTVKKIYKKINYEPIIIVIYNIYVNEQLLPIKITYKHISKQVLLTNYDNPRRKKKYKLSLTTLLKDDYKYFDMFYNHYMDQGVEFFYIYYNGKVNDDIKKVLSKENVKIIEWNYKYWNDHNVDSSLKHHAQMGQIHHALYKYGKCNSEYMIFCDLDEYMISSHRKLVHMIESKHDTYGFLNIFSELNNIPKKLPNTFLISNIIHPFRTRSKCIHNTDSIDLVKIHCGYKYKYNNPKIIETKNNKMYHFHNITSSKMRGKIEPCKILKDLTYDKKQLMYIHIPKTAGSYIEDQFKKNGYLVGRYNDTLFNKFKRDNISCNKWHSPSKYSYINFNDYIVFTVIREPISRLISEYCYMKGKKMVFIKNLFPDYYNNSQKNINDFINYYLNDADKLIYDGDCHLLPQSEYITDRYNNTIKNVIKFENLDQQLSDFINNYQLDIKLDNIKINKSKCVVNKSDIKLHYLEIIEKYYEQDFKIHNKLSNCLVKSTH